MRPMCEKIIPSDNSSWRYYKYQLAEIPFNWHYHPEYEICLTLNSKGLRYVGDHIDSYDNYDLVLLGPDLPHTWHSHENNDRSTQIVHVAQVPIAWLDQLVATHTELFGLKEFLVKSRLGIKFNITTAIEATNLFNRIATASPLMRFSTLLELLDLMSRDTKATFLSSTIFTFGERADRSRDKLDKVIDYIYENYTESLYADDLAKLAHMSTNHFHRFFKKRTELTLTEFINQLRIGKACKLLANTNSPITVISDQCGFKNMSNFNRRFLALRSCTPSQFRKQISNRIAV